jgi:hypothetical protein
VTSLLMHFQRAHPSSVTRCEVAVGAATGACTQRPAASFVRRSILTRARPKAFGAW